MSTLIQSWVRVQQVRAGSDRLMVRLSGDTGTPIVMLRGLASSSRYWPPGIPGLARSYRLNLPDLLGFGRSPKPFFGRYSPEEHVEFLHRTLAALVGAPFTLVGHSMGSALASHYAAAHPNAVSGAVLISLPVIGCLPWRHGNDGQPRTLHRLIAHSSTGARLAGMVIRAAGPLGYFLAPRAQHDVPVEAARDAMRVTAVSYWRALERVVYGTDVPALVERLLQPLLVVHGADDHTAPLEPVRELAAVSPGLRLQV
jgi:pimeloyl-ACP methyl ester carboxylesterase